MSDLDTNQNEVLHEVEEEREDEQNQIVRPFDPEKIKVKTKTALINSIVSRIEHGEIDLAPDFQRNAGIWNSVRKARLIESLLLRIPLPVFYVAADKFENWSVVDGLQRMTTIYDYVTNKFELDNLEYLAHLNGIAYKNLPRFMKRRIDETELVVHVIEPGTPDEVMFNIFRRINTGGMPLNGQEIRHALHKGVAREYVKRLAESDEFLRATDRSIRSGRMIDRECVLRYLAFRITPWEKYHLNDLDGFLSETMKILNELSDDELQRHELEFKRSMNIAFDVFGDDAFRKRYGKERGRNPISKALFEAWSVAFARSRERDLLLFAERSEEIKGRFIETMVKDRAFEVSISYSTGVPQRVQKRFQSIENILKEVLEEGA